MATAIVTGLAASLLFDFSTLEGLLIGADPVLDGRRGGLRRPARLDAAPPPGAARSRPRPASTTRSPSCCPSGSSRGSRTPTTGCPTWPSSCCWSWASASASASAFGWLAVQALKRTSLASAGLYPVASLAIAALGYGIADVAHGSGFLSVYLVGLALGTATDSRQAHHHHLPHGHGLAGAGGHVPRPRPARLPVPARRRRPRGHAARPRAGARRPARSASSWPPSAPASTWPSASCSAGRACAARSPWCSRPSR